MKFIPFTKTTVAVTLAFALTACGSSSDDSAGNASNDNPDSISGEDPSANNGQMNGDNPGSDGGDDIDITDAVPRVITSACNTLPISDAPTGLTMATATPIIEGQLARGRIHAGIAGSEENFWTIDLPAGYHHVFLDIIRGDGTAGDFGINVDTVDASGASTGRVLNGFGVRYRTRAGTLFLNDAPQTVTLRMSRPANIPFNGPQEYVLGVFANGRSIPSPFFDDCPTITPLSVGTTAALRLQESMDADDTATFQVELERGSYTLATQGSRIDGQARTFGYDFFLLDGFGVGYPGSDIGGVFSSETNGSGSTDFFYDGDGPAWINVEEERGFTDIDVEFTITPNVN